MKIKNTNQKTRLTRVRARGKGGSYAQEVIMSMSVKVGRNARAPEGLGGILFAVLVVLGLCAASFLVGWGAFGAALAAFPTADIPGWVILVFSLAALIPLLVVAIRIFPWLANWYYLLPSLVFILVFTVYPIILTFYYAFTNYSGTNSGRPDSSTEVKIERISNIELKIVDGTISGLQCKASDCSGQQIELREADTGREGLKFTLVSGEGSTLKLKQAMSEGFNPALARRINPFGFIGFGNFSEIFSKASVQLVPVAIWTVVFAFSTTIINILAGLVLGILLNNKRLKFRNFYRAMLFLPWAVPGMISILMWQTLFNMNFGGLNRLLGLFEVSPIPWLVDGLWAKMAILLVNLWLGFPYMMTATIGALSSIPEDLYEAASIDGASRWEQVLHITLPNLTAAFTPIALGTFAFNFNNFGIIYLLTAGGPVESGQLPTARSTDILLSWGYNTAFTGQGDQAYGLASAIALIVAVLTIGISVVNFRAAGVFNEARK
jgi:arabinogalactan oligomer / maltooligosaccharide transport system permease protein